MVPRVRNPAVDAAPAHPKSPRSLYPLRRPPLRLPPAAPAMEAFAGAAPAAGVFAGSGAAASRPFFLRRRGGASRSGPAGRLRLLRVPPPRVGGDGGDLPPLDKWDMMEMDFGRFLGEDPKLTLAKVAHFYVFLVLIIPCLDNTMIVG